MKLIPLVLLLIVVLDTLIILFAARVGHVGLLGATISWIVAIPISIGSVIATVRLIKYLENKK